MSAQTRQLLHIVALNLNEATIARALAPLTNDIHLVLLDTPNEPLAPTTENQIDILLVGTPPTTNPSWMRALAQLSALSRCGSVIIGTGITLPPEQPLISNVSFTTETQVAMAVEAAIDRSTSPITEPDLTGNFPDNLSNIQQSLLKLEPGDNLTQFIEQFSAILQQYLSADMVEVEVNSPYQRQVTPRQRVLPAKLSNSKELAYFGHIYIERMVQSDSMALILPLQASGHTYGSISIVNKLPQRFGANAISAIRLIAAYAARCLDSHRSQQEHRRNLDELQAIADIGRTMVASFSLPRILDMIAHTALRFIPEASRAVIHIPDERREKLVPQAQAGEPDTLALLTLPWGVGVAGKAAETKRAIYAPNAENYPDFVVGHTFIGSLLSVPLLLGQAVVGTISVATPMRDAFNERDIRLLNSLASQAAVAVENARLHHEARRADEIAALYELSQAVNSSLDLRDTINTILSSARSLTSAAAAEVRLVSAGEDSLEAVVALGDRPTSNPGDRYRMSVIYPRLVLSRKRPLMVEDTMRFEHDDEFCRHEPPQWLRSYLGLPLITNQNVVGILSLGHDRPGAFTSDDIRLLEIITGQAATALSNARLYEEATQRLQEAEALAAVSRSVASTLNPAEVLQAVAQTAVETLPLARRCFAYLLADDGTPHLVATTPQPTQGEVAFEAAIWQWCADGCLLRMEPVNLDDTIRQGFASTSASAAHSVIAVPMIAGGKAVGVLGADSTLPNAFTNGDMRLLQAFADQSAMAVENARLFADLNQTYHELAQSTETLRAVFDGITDGMYIVDSNDKIVSVNRTEALYLNRHAESLIGAQYSELYHRDDIACEHCLVQATLASGKHQSTITSYLDESGQSVWREIDAYPIQDREAVTDRVVVFARDVTKRRRIEASLYESSKLASIGQLATSIAHEVNNPLTVIIGNAEVMLLDIAENTSLRDSIEMILRAARRAARITQNLLDLSNQREYELAEVDIQQNLADALELVAHPMRKASIQVNMQVDDDVPLIIASANHLKVVWMNMLLNAKDSILRAKRINGVIEINAVLNGQDAISVSIKDNGIGILPEEKEKIFQPLYTTKPPGQGLGLGLYNAYDTILKHGGTVSVDSNPGEGTTFTVTLPLESPENSMTYSASQPSV